MAEDSKALKGMYGKPLFKGVSEAYAEKFKKEVLERAGKLAVKEIQNEIKKASWNKTPDNLIKSFTSEVKGSVMTIKSDHPAAEYLNRGVKPHQMDYLKGSKPIPIITEEGKVIFRQASSQTMADGSWQHPGIKGKHFLEKGMDKARTQIKKEVASAYAKLIADMIKGDVPE